MTQKVQAMVIKSNDRKEKDKNILLFSIEKGKFWATLKAVKSPKAKLKAAQSQFAFGEFLLEEGKAGFIVTSFECVESFFEVTEDVDKYFAATSVLEILNKMEFSSIEERAKILILTIKTLKNLCFSKTNPNYLLAKFMIEVLKVEGNNLFTEQCSTCKSKVFDKIYINYNIGELVCTACKTPPFQELEKPVYLALKLLTNTDFDKISTIKLAQGSELALLKILCKNFESIFSIYLNFIGVLT